jgi:hypothetical protein
MLTHYEFRLEGHAYYSPVDEPEHLDPGDIDKRGFCVHGVQQCQECGK